MLTRCVTFQTEYLGRWISTVTSGGQETLALILFKNAMNVNTVARRTARNATCNAIRKSSAALNLRTSALHQNAPTVLKGETLYLSTIQENILDIVFL